MNNNFFDTHAHVYKEYYENIDSVIKRAEENNVLNIINAGVDQKTNEEVLKISENYNKVYCTLGIHPENVNKYTDEDIVFIEDNLKNKKVLAIGEIGLDYHYEKDSREAQIILFEKQLLLAEKNNVPVVIHSREATLDTINTLKKFKVKGVIHSFSGSLETAREYIKLGFSLGVNGVVTFKNCNMSLVYKNIDLRNIVLETDCPYLSPVPLRGKTNEPANIVHIAKYLSELYSVDIEQIANITTENTRRIFDKI